MGAELVQDNGLQKRRKTSSVVDIPDSARKEIEYLFLHDIVDTVEKYEIPLSLNLDQTPLKYVPVDNETMALSGSQSVTIEGSSDKRCITGTFTIAMHGEFLPVHQPLDLTVNKEANVFLKESLLIGIHIKFEINFVKTNR